MPGVAVERATLTQLMPARTTVVEHQAATRAAVLRLLRTHNWVHFSCHGSQDLRDPSRGGVHLNDTVLTIADIAAIHRDEPGFAFLSACQTAVGGLDNPDEVITLAAALQNAGWQHVIGTLWTVLDSAATRITRYTYHALVVGGRLDPSRAAQALHRAVHNLRDEEPDTPSTWVPFVHIGP